MNSPLHTMKSRARRAQAITFVLVGAFTLFACSGNDDDDKNTALATKASGASSSSSGSAGGACTGTAVQCSNGTLTACEDGTTKTVSCQEQCAADGFEQGSGSCVDDGSRCACGKTTDQACTDGMDAVCSCLDTSAACQGTNILYNYIRCHRDPSSETATIAKCFAKYKSGDQIACNTAISSCGSSGPPSGGCTADADCGHCERCERSTGKCLTKVACK